MLEPMTRRRDVNGAADAPRELDVVEVVVDGAEVPRGTRGTIVDDPGTGTYLLVVVDETGQTRALPEVSREQVRVVWRLHTQPREAITSSQRGG